jgi:D-alanyl-D-alanine carboxypeptidase (penicillin-binding protein 5/6)
MSTSLPSPGRSRRGSRRGNRRRRRRGSSPRWPLRLAAVAVLGVAGAAAIIATRNSARAHHAPAPTPASVPAAPRALSPTGLALGRPPFTLAGLASSAGDPLRMTFRTPPRAGLLFDLDSGRVLWQLKPLRRLEIASLTKMMTALLTVESAPPRARVLVTREAVAAAGSKVGVLPLGRRVPLESMLYGLMLPSGNDAAVALAQYLDGTVPRFVARMNAAAAKLGLGCTRFSSPSGYVDRENYSCAADLAELAELDLAQPRVARIARTRSAILPFPIKGGRLYLYNNNPLLRYAYPGTTGLKTGYTLAAGRCLVATAERHGVRLGVVLLDSPDPATQASGLLDQAFERIYDQRPVAEPPIPAYA